MSRAFVKESDGDGAGDLPDLPVSQYPNYVTPHGLALLRDRLDETQRRLAAIDPNADGERLTRAHVERERRWLQRRVLAAIPVLLPANADRVGFGATVDLTDEHDATYSYRIVGEDEADPEQGLISWVSPLARALHGARVGDSVTWPRPAGDRDVEVVGIGYPSGPP